MSVDKFGRFDRDIKGLTVPSKDVASIGFVQNNFLPLSTANNHYDAKLRSIRNVALPLTPYDAANMKYVKSYSLGMAGDTHYTAKNKFIRDLRDPVLPSDAATLSFVNKGSVKRTQPDGDIDLESRLVRNLGDPVLPSDAATMGFVTRNSLKRTHPDGDVDLEGKLVRNLGVPVLPTDAVNMEYISKNTPKVNDAVWKFDEKRLSNIQDPIYDGEAVNLRTLRKHLDKTITQHEGRLERLSSAIFDYIHRSSGRSAELGVTNKNFVDWNTILVD